MESLRLAHEIGVVEGTGCGGYEGNRRQHAHEIWAGQQTGRCRDELIDEYACGAVVPEDVRSAGPVGHKEVPIRSKVDTGTLEDAPILRRDELVDIVASSSTISVDRVRKLVADIEV